ncbi:MAG: ATP-binding protein, partial [Chloroflexota bacterium]|nr:ATP-binding protein [Chloroflexota bacterium]
AGPVIMVDRATETRFQPDAIVQEHDIVSGIAIMIRGGDQPFGVLNIHTARRRTFSPAEIGFLQSIANLLGNAVASRRAEESRAQLAHTLELLLESVGEGIYGLDHSGRCTFINHAGAATLGYSPDELVGQALHPLIHHSYADGSPYPVADCPILQALVAGRHCQITDEVLWRRDGIPLPVDYSSYPILEDGVNSGAVVTFVDIRARRQAEAIRLAGLAAEEANVAKNEFLSRMSHELRTPLNAVLGFAQILEMGTTTPKQTESLGYILRAGRHLLTLINEVLDITRVESGQVLIEQVPVVLRDLLQESLDLVRPLAIPRQIHLTLELPEELPPTVLGDRLRLLQVLLNLLTNAVKYNRLGGTVTLRCEPVADQVRILVCDTGPGLTPEQVARLFTPFERLGAEQTDTEGSGLGLALSRRLVEAMDGTIGVASVPGAGSTFWVSLIAGSPAAALPASSAGGEVVVARPAGPHTILYIEDNLSNLRLVERILDNRPAIKLLTALQGQSGLDLAVAQAPALILLDLHLPDLTGAEVLRRLRANPLTAATPVVIISADATPAQVA